MAAASLPKGIAISFSNTPQANADYFTAAQSGLTEDNLLGLILLDVMANDLGGNAKSLYSLDDGVNSGGATGDLLMQDAIGVANLSAHGATIKITADGRISYDATTLNTSFKSDLQHLSDGEFATDTFSYAIRLGNGTLSWTTDTVQIAGVNDAPVAANIAADANEDGNPVTLTASYADIDAHDTDTIAINTTGTKGVVVNNGGGTFSYDPNGQFESLALGETATDTFTYTVTDNHGASSTRTATVTIHGENDAPAAANIAASTNEDTGDPVTLTASYTDVDGHDTHTFTINTTGTEGAVVNNGDGTFSYDPNGQFESLALGETAIDTFSYTVTDNHGASSTKTATVTVHGENDAPALQGAVPDSQILNQSTGLTLTATMAFADGDLLDTHSVTFTALTSGSIGTFAPTIGTDSTNSGHGSVSLTYQLTPAQFMTAGGHAPDHQDYRVTIDDRHGGTSSQIVSIPLAQILSEIGNGGGDGGGGGTTTQPPVFTIFSPPSPFAPGQNKGQITDNPFVLHPSFIPPGGFSTDLFTQGTLNFVDPDGGHHHASVDLSHAFISSHFVAEPGGGSHSAGAPTVTTSTGTWQVDVRDDINQVSWSYTLNESAIRSMVQGEWLTMIFPITVFEDGVGQSTTNVRIDVLGTDEPTSLVTPNTAFTATTDITPYLLPIDLATHVQTQNVSISENPLVTGSTNLHQVSGTIYFVDPDRLDNPTVSMTLNDPGVPLSPEVESVRDGFSYTVEQFGNYGMIHWTYNVQDSELDFLPQDSGLDFLPYDGKLTVGATFNIGATPGGPGGGGSLSTVNVTLHGANDPVVIPGSHTAAMNVALGGSASGNFMINDPDGYPDGHTVDVVAHNPSLHGFMFAGTPVETGVGGNEPISWTYFADFGPGTLVAGQHDVWDVVVHDHFGSVATYTLDFHLV